MADGDARAPGIELGAVDRPERGIAAEAIAAVVLRIPGLERAEDLGGESFVDLVEVEVLEREPRAIKHARHRVRRRHQHALLRPAHPDEIDRRGFGVGEIRKRLEVAALRPAFGSEQNACGTIRERRAVARGERAGGGRIECRAQ